MSDFSVKDPHAQPADEVVSQLSVDPVHGLTLEEAALRLAECGPNELPKPKKRSPLLLFFGQFNNRLIYILLAATVISFLSGQRNDAYGILLAVLVNAVFGFWQERKAEVAIEQLQAMIVPESTVLRDGNVCRLRSAEIVPGDILLLQEGDRIPADGRLVSSKDLRTDESSLTGESGSVRKGPESVGAAVGRSDMTDMVWMGTSVVAGTVRAVVTATGTRTAFGGIAVSLSSIREEPSPLQKRIDRLGQKLGLASVVLAGVVFMFGWLDGFSLQEMFFFSVALVVSIIPEGLPAVLAVVLAIGVQRMAKRNAIIRHVPSVETLGVTDVICTDKTGTLTENKMTVRQLHVDGRDWSVTGEGWKPEGAFMIGGRKVHPAEMPTLNRLLKAGVTCNHASLTVKDGRPDVIGDPTEAALVVMGAKAGFDRQELLAEFKLVDEIPFSSTRRYQARLVESRSLDGVRKRQLFVVGAFETLRSRSVSVGSDGGPLSLAEAEDDLDAAVDRLGERAMRVLAVACRAVSADEPSSIGDADVYGLELLGLVGMVDPPRVGVAEAIAKCRRAGVRVMMATGDHKATALAIARQVGIIDGDCSVGGPRGVFTDQEVATMSDDQFDLVLGSASVFARVSPETKLRIVERLELAGHVVAMTGDGVNDAPALKRASIGVSMGIGGTDVSKGVSDMVLADDNFISIVSAVEEGRIIFRNVKQTVGYLFMTNIGEAVTVLVSLIAHFPLPLLPAQILWMNLVTDGLPGVALATERRAKDVLDRSPHSREAPILTRRVLFLTVITAALMCLGTLGLFSWALRSGDLSYARTVAFTSMVVFQLCNVFSMRSIRTSIFRLGFLSNGYVFLAVVASMLMQVAVLYLPPLQRIFRTVPLGLVDWAAIVVVSSSVFFAVEIYKWFLRRKALSDGRT
ncbi:ATPase [Candidatus Uhrbacteria bacterium CG_4_10_14_0_8_um_filter_58_22]|uniref:ATPase n=1 Tax=Candidatus Uhrbacteria bacterium CG_4_10_14_0_8_um_filter_58_22 TaxID=1975029 RepID=A0A2M7Q992_9BACT|nr:MAG: ATPase [Candidatus Uhrbacteria bacterium CG_4_10_14_0_8_um_filter_58_22]